VEDIRGSRSRGYHTDTVAEDADLTMALLRNGYRVQYEDLALAYTEAPINANGLMRQRFRWSFGICSRCGNIVRCLRAKERWAGLLYPILLFFKSYCHWFRHSST